MTVNRNIIFDEASRLRLENKPPKDRNTNILLHDDKGSNGGKRIGYIPPTERTEADEKGTHS